MVNFSLDKDDDGIVNLTMQFHEDTELDLLLEFVRTQAGATLSSGSQKSKKKKSKSAKSKRSEPEGSNEPEEQETFPEGEVMSELAESVEPSIPDVTSELPEALVEPELTLKDLSDNELAVALAMLERNSAVEEAKDLLPRLYKDKRFKSRSDDHASIVRYLLRSLISKGFVEETNEGRVLVKQAELCISEAKEALEPSEAVVEKLKPAIPVAGRPKVSAVSSGPEPYSWRPGGHKLD